MIEPIQLARRSFVVDAVEITDLNYWDASNWCSGNVHSPEHGAFWIEVPIVIKKKRSFVKAFEGDTITRSPKGFRVYQTRDLHSIFQVVDSMLPSKVRQLIDEAINEGDVDTADEVTAKIMDLFA